MSKLTTEEYLERLDDNAGNLNRNFNKFKETSPDFGGFIKVENKVYRVSAWINPKSKNISMRILKHNEL